MLWGSGGAIARRDLFFVCPFSFVIPALLALSVGVCFFSSFRRKPESISLLIFRADAKTASRPCAVCPSSLAASHFLLLAQEKVTKEKGTLAAAVTRASM